MQKLLITFGTRPLAQRLSKLLQNKFEILFATSEDVPSFLSLNYAKIPTGVNPTYAHELLKLSLDRQIDYVLPLGQTEIGSIVEAKILFEEYGIQLLCPEKAMFQQVFVLENPNSSIELTLLLNGRSLNGEMDFKESVSGLFAISDRGDEIALCTI